MFLTKSSFLLCILSFVLILSDTEKSYITFEYFPELDSDCGGKICEWYEACMGIEGYY